MEDIRHTREVEMAQTRLKRDTEIASIFAKEREELEAIRSKITHELERVLTQQEQCEVEEEETACRKKLNKQIEDIRSHFEEQKEMVREERDIELEKTRQDMDATLANVTSGIRAQYEAIQQSREHQLEELRAEHEVEYAAEGIELVCSDQFDDQIEAERKAMEKELERMQNERDDTMQDIKTNRTERVEQLENERQERLDALREEWKKACTDQCTMCRESQEELLEAVHLEYEENISEARIHWDEQERITDEQWKEAMDSFRSRRQANIDR